MANLETPRVWSVYLFEDVVATSKSLPAFGTSSILRYNPFNIYIFIYTHLLKKHNLQNDTDLIITDDSEVQESGID